MLRSSWFSSIRKIYQAVADIEIPYASKTKLFVLLYLCICISRPTGHKSQLRIGSQFIEKPYNKCGRELKKKNRRRYIKTFSAYDAFLGRARQACMYEMGGETEFQVIQMQTQINHFTLIAPWILHSRRTVNRVRSLFTRRYSSRSNSLHQGSHKVFSDKSFLALGLARRAFTDRNNLQSCFMGPARP